MSARPGLLSRAWSLLRAISGEDAYERYLAHHLRAHPGRPPLGRAAFHRAEQDRRWSQVNRCC